VTTPPLFSESTLSSLARLAEERKNHLGELRFSGQGAEWCRRHSELIDQVWEALEREMQQRWPSLPPLAVVATGGYGREEVCPYSDCDVSLVPLVETPELNEAIRWVYRASREAIEKILRIRLGYVYRLVGDAPGLDAITLSSLMDARLVTGSPEPLRKLESAILGSFPTADFLIAKLDERAREKRATNETPLVVEPHLKHGAGGLRDFHLRNWIGLAIGERKEPLTPEVDHILSIRNMLHLVSGKAGDHLNLARRNELASFIGISPYELGEELADALEKNHAATRSSMERLYENRYPLTTGVQVIRGAVRVEAGTSAGEAARGIALGTKLGLDVEDVRAPITDQAGPESLFAVTQGVAIIENVDRTGVLEVLLPELSACKTLMPIDESHTYTVDEHTLQVHRNFQAITPDHPLGTLLAEAHEDTRLGLSLAILLHDIGKVNRARPHSETGAEMAEVICTRWRLDESLKSLVVWLVREHLAMSRFIRLRDVMLPETAQEFARLVGSSERLRALAILTYCDVNAVNSSLWTPVQETFLRALFERTLAVLTEQSTLPKTEEAAKERVLRGQAEEAIDEEALEAFLDTMPPHYLLSTDPASVRRHFLIAEAARQGGVSFDIYHHRELGVTDFTIASPDSAGALSKILGAIYALDLSLVGLRASTSGGESPLLLDTFTVSSSGQILSKSKVDQLSNAIRDLLTDRSDLESFMASHGRDANRKQTTLRIQIEPRDPAIIEVQAPRGRGLAFRVSRVISGLGLNILAARLGQWAGNGSAAFYVQYPDGRPVEKETILGAFRSQ